MIAMPATRVWRGTVRGIGLRQAPVGQPHQSRASTPLPPPPPGEQEPCGKKQEKQVSGSWQTDRPEQKPGGGKDLGDGQGGQRRLAQGISRLCGLGAGLMGAVGRIRERVSA